MLLWPMGVSPTIKEKFTRACYLSVGKNQNLWSKFKSYVIRIIHYFLNHLGIKIIDLNDNTLHSIFC